MLNTQLHDSTFSEVILTWYKNFKINKLPWQLKKTMYSTWLSEIMLQQTQVNTVIPYYEKFIQSFPEIKKLAIANLNEVLYLWSGLGYYARAVNLHKTAQIIMKYYNNEFPQDFEILISLPGIGRSTAGAILSLSLNKRYPILDSNVKRILMRYYRSNFSLPVKALSEINRNLWSLSEKLLPISPEISNFNQAIMNLGRLICTNKFPKCNLCPIKNNCQSFLTKTINQYSTNKRKTFIKKNIWFLLLLYNCKEIWLEQRNEESIWNKLFCFPEFPDLSSCDTWLFNHNITNYKYKNITTSKHKISNMMFEIHPRLIYLNKKLKNLKKNGIWCNINKLPTIGIPKPIFLILKKINQNCTVTTHI